MAGEDTGKDTPQTESERWKAFAQGGENKSEFTPLRRTYTPSNPSGPSISVYELDTRITGMNLSTVFRTVAGAQDGHSETVRDASLRTFQSLKSDTGVQILTDGDGVTAANVMETNDVVVYSMAGKAVLENTGDAKRKDTFADYHVTPDEIIDTMRKAADDRAILVQSAGNGGDFDVMSNGLERQTPDVEKFHPYRIAVGAAKADMSGNLNIEAYSSVNGPSFVSAIPEKMHYLEPVQTANIRNEIIKNYSENFALNGLLQDLARQQPDAGINSLPMASTADQLKELKQTFEEEGTNPKSLTAIFRAADKGAYSVLNETIDAATRAESLKRQQSNAEIDAKQGASVQGTSFTAPVAGAIIADARNKHPGLTNYDYMAAARIAARPMLNADPSRDQLEYSQTGNDRLWNIRTGFGYMDPARLENEVLPEMEKLRSGGATTVEKNLQTEDMNFSAPSSVSHDGKKYYDIPVTESATVLSQGFYMGFRNGQIPPEIEIVAPNGKSAKIAPSRSVDETDTLRDDSIATTDAHFGSDSRGVWKIGVPAGYSLTSATGFMTGVERGGVIDKTIAAFPQEKPSVLKINPDLSATPVAAPAAPSPSNDTQGMVFIPAISPAAP